MIHAKNWMNPIKFSFLISMVWMATLSSTVQAATDIEFETLDGKTEEDAVVAYLQVLGTMAKLDDEKAYRE